MVTKNKKARQKIKIPCGSRRIKSFQKVCGKKTLETFLFDISFISSEKNYLQNINKS
jgi:hypothetical protein